MYKVKAWTLTLQLQSGVVHSMNTIITNLR